MSVVDFSKLPPRPKKGEADYEKKLRAHVAAYNKVYREANKEKIAALRVAWEKSNSEKRAAYQTVYREANKEKITARRVAWEKANPEKRKTASRRRRAKRVGLLPADIDAMIENQNGLCAICGNPPNGKKATAILQLDHCHTTGKMRAMLCNKCNVALGHVMDQPGLLRTAADYLEKHTG